MDTTTVKDIEEYLRERAKDNPPKTQEEFLKLLDEALHELRAMGKITRDSDLQYIENLFSKRWRFFVNN
ncbi:hypothetical protein J7L09_01710 [bacterium]|nr:hypothetical protein [bacterium]